MTLSIFSSSQVRRTRDQLAINDLVTVELFSSNGALRSGARITRIEPGTIFVKLVGLEVPRPYAIGDMLPLNPEKIVDWD
jgi:hypothetical protein